MTKLAGSPVPSRKAGTVSGSRLSNQKFKSRLEKSSWRKVRHDKELRIDYEGFSWVVDCAEWRDDQGRGQLRVYRIIGDVTTPMLREALQNEADGRGLVVMQ